jgi:hypothetical protein
MFNVILSIILYTIFGLIGIYGLSKILFIKKNFENKQNVIYLLIFYIVFGFFIGQLQPESTNIAYQIGFGLGNCFAAIIGAAISSFFANKNKFLINKVFYMAILGVVTFGTLILFINSGA